MHKPRVGARGCSLPFFTLLRSEPCSLYAFVPLPLINSQYSTATGYIADVVRQAAACATLCHPCCVVFLEYPHCPSMRPQTRAKRQVLGTCKSSVEYSVLGARRPNPSMSLSPFMRYKGKLISGSGQPCMHASDCGRCPGSHTLV
jgi:hypothetical protein